MNGFLTMPIIPSGNFSWGEALHGGSRIPQDVKIFDNIVALATALQPYRQRSGVPWRVNSWYRTPEANEATGGAKNSLHLRGLAVDVEIPLPREKVREILKNWPGGLGEYDRHWHLDLGDYRRWTGVSR